MKIKIGNLTFDGWGSGNLKLENLIGFEAERPAQFFNTPRSDYRKFISDYIEAKERIVSVFTDYFNAQDFIAIRKEINGLVGNSYKIELIDDDQNGTPYFEYEFTGRVTRIVSKQEQRTASQGTAFYDIEVSFEDPFIYDKAMKVSEELNLQSAFGLKFPLKFPIQWQSGKKNISITNSGQSANFLEIEFFGEGTGFSIKNTTDNKEFVFLGTINDGNSVKVTPYSYDPIKVRDQDGASRLTESNYNWDALYLEAGSTKTFELGVSADSNDNTKAVLLFNPPLLGIL